MQGDNPPYIPENPTQTTSKQKTKQALKILKIINIVSAIVLIVVSGLSVFGAILEVLTSLKVFLVASPVFMLVFGVLMLAAQMNIKIILKKAPFMKIPIVRGLFYLYLSSVVYYLFEYQKSPILAWVGAISLFISALFYIVLHFGLSKHLKKEDFQESYEETYKQRLI